MTDDDNQVYDNMEECYNCKSQAHAHTMTGHYHDGKLIHVCPECESDE